jgi:peptide/nickel transport system ATP-binding protein
VSVARAESVVVEGLTVGLTGGANIVEDLSLHVAAGEVLGLVGESGSGKTTVALALLGFANEGVRIRAGSVKVGGEELVGRPDHELRRLRGRLISYVPQEPATALNPALRIGDQIREVLRFHAPERANDAEVAAALESVHLPGSRAFRRRYPHQLSGGQQQRVSIAIALVCHPLATVLDEPTTGLDVVTQARILEEIARIRTERAVALLYVSHDLAVISKVADRVAVMYAGRIVEQGATEDVITRPRHPYTRGLLASVPDHVAPRMLHGIPGVAVGVGDRGAGCAFAPRCPQRIAACEVTLPALEPLEGGRSVRCFAWQSTPAISFESRAAGPSIDQLARLLAVDDLHAEHRSRRGAEPVCTPPRRDESFSTALSSRRARETARARSAAACRSSSRTPMSR